MPISPENMARYPGGSIRSPEWLAIRAHILARATDANGVERCEHCGVPNRVAVYRRGSDKAWSCDLLVSDCWRVWRCARTGAYLGRAADPSARRLVMIVLTIAHLDHDPAHNADTNLAALCQRCHNAYDQPHRQANAAATREVKRATNDNRKRAS